MSVAERYVEILADEGINSKVDPATWQDLVDTLIEDIHRGRVVEGFRKTVESVGAILADHVPADGKNPNELPDHLFMI